MLGTLANLEPTPTSNLFIIVGAIAAAIATIVVARRRTSGGIRTSEASSLWLAYNELQERQEKEIARLQRDEADCRSRCTKLEQDLRELTRKYVELGTAHEELKRRFEALEKRRPPRPRAA